MYAVQVGKFKKFKFDENRSIVIGVKCKRKLNTIALSQAMCDFLNLSQLFERKVFFGNEVLSLSLMANKGLSRKRPLYYIFLIQENQHIQGDDL